MSLSESIAIYKDAINARKEEGETWASIRSRLQLDCSDQAFSVAHKRSVRANEQVELPDLPASSDVYAEPPEDYEEPEFTAEEMAFFSDAHAPAPAPAPAAPAAPTAVLPQNTPASVDIDALEKSIQNQIVSGGSELLQGIQLFRKQLLSDLVKIYKDAPKKFDETLTTKSDESVARLTRAAEYAVKRKTLQIFHPVIWLLAGVIAAAVGGGMTYGGLYFTHHIATPLPHGMLLIRERTGTVLAIGSSAETMTREQCSSVRNAALCYYLPK